MTLKFIITCLLVQGIHDGYRGEAPERAQVEDSSLRADDDHPSITLRDKIVAIVGLQQEIGSEVIGVSFDDFEERFSELCDDTRLAELLGRLGCLVVEMTELGTATDSDLNDLALDLDTSNPLVARYVQDVQHVIDVDALEFDDILALGAGLFEANPELLEQTKGDPRALGSSVLQDLYDPATPATTARVLRSIVRMVVRAAAVGHLSTLPELPPGEYIDGLFESSSSDVERCRDLLAAFGLPVGVASSPMNLQDELARRRLNERRLGRIAEILEKDPEAWSRVLPHRRVVS